MAATRMQFRLSRPRLEVTSPLSSSEEGAQERRSPDEESVGTLARRPAPVWRHPFLSPAGPGSSTGRKCVSARRPPDTPLHQFVIVAEHAERWTYVFRRRT